MAQRIKRLRVAPTGRLQHIAAGADLLERAGQRLDPGDPLKARIAGQHRLLVRGLDLNVFTRLAAGPGRHILGKTAQDIAEMRRTLYERQTGPGGQGMDYEARQDLTSAQVEVEHALRDIEENI